jgi:hypothetical protein
LPKESLPGEFFPELFRAPVLILKQKTLDYVLPLKILPSSDGENFDNDALPS